MLIYSRAGARPHGHSREEQQAAAEEEMDIEATSGSTDTLPTAQRGAVRPPDLLIDDNEPTSPQDGDSVMAEGDAPQQPPQPQLSQAQPLQQSPPTQQAQQEIDMQEPGPRPEPHHAHTTDDKGDWELVEGESTEKPSTVHWATR